MHLSIIAVKKKETTIFKNYFTFQRHRTYNCSVHGGGFITRNAVILSICNVNDIDICILLPTSSCYKKLISHGRVSRTVRL